MIAGNHHMWSIYGSETAVSETAISQLQNRSKYRILHSQMRNPDHGRPVNPLKRTLLPNLYNSTHHQNPENVKITPQNSTDYVKSAY